MEKKQIERMIYKVAFSEPPLPDDDRTEFYFTSLISIYEVFTVTQIGCGARRLYNLKVSHGIPYLGRRCQISREPLTHKPRKPPV